MNGDEEFGEFDGPAEANGMDGPDLGMPRDDLIFLAMLDEEERGGGPV